MAWCVCISLLAEFAIPLIGMLLATLVDSTLPRVNDKHSTFPFSFVPVFHACTAKDAAPFNTANISLLQVLYSKFESDGELNPKFEVRLLELPISSIKTYLKELVTPHIVHVSSAGVNPPDRPGLDLTKQPPAVRMNKELSYILTFKLKGEDLVQESGIPYTIVCPCALTEVPPGV
jgi:hypothetical protein